MTSRWTFPTALLASAALAAAILALVLSRDPAAPARTVTYLVLTDATTPLPEAGLVETPDGHLVRLEFIPAPADLNPTLGGADAAGLLLDAHALENLPRDQLRAWRSVAVLAIYGVDPAEVWARVDLGIPARPISGSANQFVRVGGADLSRTVGDPASIDRDEPYWGLTYRPPALTPDTDLGYLGWFQQGDPTLEPWLAQWALDSLATRGVDR